MSFQDGANLLIALYNKTDNYWYLYLLWVVATLGWIAAPTPKITWQHRLLVVLSYWVVAGMVMGGLLISYAMMTAARIDMLAVATQPKNLSEFAGHLDPAVGYWLTIGVQIPVGLFVTWAIWHPEWVEALVPRKTTP